MIHPPAHMPPTRPEFTVTRLLHRSIHATLPQAVTGEGVFLHDSDGKSYLDGSGGAAVSCLGHAHPVVTAAVKRQVEALAYAHTSFFTTEAAETLGTTLSQLAPGHLDYVYLVSGGSEAVEAALKMARQYHVEKGQPQRRHIIARRQSYHGNTIGALATGGNELRRSQFRPILPETHHVSPCYAYRDQRPGETDASYAARLAQELEDKIIELGLEEVMAFVCEPVVGATLGAVPPVPGYLSAIRAVCDRYGVLLICDEVMCGMGRTGSVFAVEQDGIVPDIITIAKGLGGGYQPIGAVLLSDEIFATFRDGSGMFQHGHTYIGHPVAAAAANAVLDIVATPEMMARVTEMGERLQTALEDALNQIPCVGNIRGRGLFRGVELVADRETKAPFDPSRKVHAKVKRAALDLGLMCYPMPGTIDGQHGDHVLLAPPYIISPDEIDMLADRLAGAIRVAIDH